MARKSIKFRHHWEAYYLSFEVCVSVVMSIGFGLWVVRFDGDIAVQDFLDGRRSDLYGNLATIFVSLLGSMFTVASITIAIINFGRMRLIRENRTLHTLGRTYISAIVWLLVGLLVTLLCLWFEGGSSLTSVLIVLLFFSTSVIIFRVARVAWIVSNLIRIMTTSKPMNRD